MEKRGRKKEIILLVVLILVLIVIVGIIFFVLNKETCEDVDCFFEKMAECKRAEFIQNDDGGIWKYEILGKNGENCKINVELVQIKEGKLSLEKLEGKSMECDIPVGLVIRPEKQIGNCHGILKESIQEEMINKMHAYIFENIGEISNETIMVV